MVISSYSLYFEQLIILVTAVDKARKKLAREDCTVISVLWSPPIAMYSSTKWGITFDQNAIVM